MYKIYEGDLGMVVRDEDGNFLFEADTLDIAKYLIELMIKDSPEKPIRFYAEGEDRVVCPNEFCNGGESANVYAGEQFCSECGQRLGW